jgi:hypothetical protein
MKMLLAVVLTGMSFLAVQAVWAERPEVLEWSTVEGIIEHIYPEDSTIVIKDEGDILYTITGFPFGYLENELDSYFENELDIELDIEIKKNDCVTVKYAEVRCKTVYKYIAVALTRYCENCGVDVCYEDDDGILLRDGDLYPVDKSRNDDDSDHYHHHKQPGNGN